MNQAGLDKLFMRLKDIILICGAIYTFAAWGFGIAALPPRVQAQEVAQSKATEKNIKQDQQIQELYIKFEYIKESLTEIQRSQQTLTAQLIDKNQRGVQNGAH